MATSEFPTLINDSLSHFGDVALTTRSPIKLRGANFKNTSYLYSNETTDKQWLWKRSTDTQVMREYIASHIASKLNVNVPRAHLAQKGTQLGLLYEWLDESVELRDSSTLLLKKCPSRDVLRLLLLEALIGASDRHSGNYLIVEDKIWAIDLERSFGTEPLDSELLLYFEWLSNSQKIVKEEIDEFKKDINELNVLHENSKIFNTIDNLQIDNRAKFALKIQVENMFESLNENYQCLMDRIQSYIQKSNNRPLF